MGRALGVAGRRRTSRIGSRLVAVVRACSSMSATSVSSVSRSWNVDSYGSPIRAHKNLYVREGAAAPPAAGQISQRKRRVDAGGRADGKR